VLGCSTGRDSMPQGSSVVRARFTVVVSMDAYYAYAGGNPWARSTAIPAGDRTRPCYNPFRVSAQPESQTMPTTIQQNASEGRHWGRGPTVLLALVLAFSAWIRATDILWCIRDNPGFTHSLHSDEVREIGDTLLMHPSFAGLRPSPWLQGKGTFLPSVGVLFHSMVAGSPLRGPFELLAGHSLDSPAGRYILFRSLSVVASLVLAYIIFLLAAHLSGSGYAGVLAVLFFSTSFSVAFSAVLFKADMLVSALVGALLLAQVRYARRPSLRGAILMGALLGACAATKYLGALAVVIPLLAIALAPLTTRRARLAHLLACGLSAGLALFICAPYMFIDFPVFTAAVENLRRYTVTRTYQFEGFGPQPIAIVTQLLVPGLGLLFVLAAFLGLGAAVTRLRSPEERRLLLPGIGHLVVHYVAISLNVWLVARYTLPLLPFLAALAGIVTWRALAALVARRTWAARLALSSVVALVGIHTAQFLALNRLISEPVPTVQAANWLRDNVPPSTAILEIRRREPEVYGFSTRLPRRLTATEVENMVADGHRLGSLPVDLVVVCETSFRDFFRLKGDTYARQRDFYEDLFDKQRFALVHRFETPARFLGIDVRKGFLPQDLVIVSPDTYVFKRLGPH
jgi:hypothetical protein